MSLHFVEFPGFTEVVEYFLKNDEGYAQLHSHAALERLAPRQRQAEWSSPVFEQILKIDSYDKSAADDLSPDQCRRLAQYVSQYQECLEKRKK